jgi:NADH:ubiquinone oxidoreductase subunit E
MEKKIQKIEVCCGGDCVDNGAKQVLQALETKYGSAVEPCGCVDKCEKAVNVIVDEKEIFSYSKPGNIVERIENEQGEPYKKFTEESLKLSDDFLDDL